MYYINIKIKEEKMKKYICKTTILLLSLSLLLSSCASNKNTAVQPDSLSDDEGATALPVKNDNKKTTSRYNTKAEKKNFFDRMFTYGNKNDFVSNDVTSVFTHGVGVGIYQQKATILINPEEGTAGFGSVYLASYYIMQYTPENYQKLSDAYEKYLDDFENKRLDRKEKNAQKKYGTMNVHLDWGTIKTSTPNNGNGKAYIGYEFVKKSPYFTITIYPVENDYYPYTDGAVSRESIMLRYYFTKAQMRDLLNMTSEEAVNKFMVKYAEENIVEQQTGDGYEE